MQHLHVMQSQRLSPTRYVCRTCSAAWTASAPAPHSTPQAGPPPARRHPVPTARRRGRCPPGRRSYWRGWRTARRTPQTWRCAFAHAPPAAHAVPGDAVVAKCSSASAHLRTSSALCAILGFGNCERLLLRGNSVSPSVFALEPLNLVWVSSAVAAGGGGGRRQAR